MKILLFVAFIFLSIFSYSQKKYDCIVITKHGGGDNIDSIWAHRFVGTLKSIGDSTFFLTTKKDDKLFNWQDIQVIKFRKHNGFSRTILPIVLLFAGAAAADADISYKNSQQNGSCGCLKSNEVNPTFIIFPAVFVMALPIATPIYFITRNHSFSINSYSDFLKLKRNSSRYVFK